MSDSAGDGPGDRPSEPPGDRLGDGVWGRVRGLQTALADDDVRSISRRYFISNGFDGALTGIGVALGAYLSGVPDGLTVFQIALGAAVGLGTSGVWSVWEIERAEQQVEIQRVERAMLTDLDDTRIHRESRRARTVSAIMSGFGPIVGLLLPQSAYLLAGGVADVLSLLEATLLAVSLGVAVLFVFGAYMGSISKQRWYVAGVRMGLAGVVVALVNLVLPG